MSKSKTPVRRPEPQKKTSVGSRSFKRSMDAQRVRSARRQALRQRSAASGMPSIDVRALMRRLPRAAWICALIAALNAFAWSIVTPPFQGKDETYHFAYIEHLAEYGNLPENLGEGINYAPQEGLVMEGLHTEGLWLSPNNRFISSVAEERTLSHDLKAKQPLKGPGGAGIASSEPPLYYAIQAVPYAVARSNMLDQIQLMRMFGVLLAGLTALFTFLFLRETLPSMPWAATVGGICVALQPLLGFMSGSVAPDSMLYAVAAALFYFLARAFRRGLTRRDAAILGVLTATGFLTKLNFVGLSFGVFVGMAALAAIAARRNRREGLVLLGLSAGIGWSPVMLYALANLASHHQLLGIASSFSLKSFPQRFSYVWELYLPRLPGMTHYFQGIDTLKNVWFSRFVGLYGWMDTTFPMWVVNLALIPATAIVLLCGRELARGRAALRARLPELITYASMTLGVLVMIGLASYVSDAVGHKLAFGEPRYLLPMLPLLGAIVALAVRGAGRRFAPIAGATMVMLFLAHDLFSQLQVIARYYG